MPRPRREGVSVKLEDLEMLNESLNRCRQSQKRLIDSMTFFLRNMEDEKAIMDEAKQGVERVIQKAKIEKAVRSEQL